MAGCSEGATGSEGGLLESALVEFGGEALLLSF